MWSNVISPSSPQTNYPENDPSSSSSPPSPTSQPPPTRYKHSTSLHYSKSDSSYYIYVYGGRSGTFALKDFWELNAQTGEWREIAKPTDSPTGTETWPPRLQEHTLVSANNRLYVFGGECHHNSDTNSHVWVWQREHENRGWEKIRFKQECSSGGGGIGSGGGGKRMFQCAPVMRRGHTAVVCEVDGGAAMVIYGGYRDLKGSLGDCWAYAVATNTWTLLTTPSTPLSPNQQKSQLSFWTNILSYWTNSSSSSSTSYTNLTQANGYYKCKHQDNELAGQGPQPPPRHNHSAVHYNGKMYVYGGMCDLVELSDFWMLDLESRKWSQVKCMFNPGVLKGHSAVVVGGFMYVFGGETKGGVRVDDVWRFDFCGEMFERLSFPGCHPCPRVFATATKLPIRRKRNQDPQPSAPQQEKQPSPKPTRPSTFRKSTSVVRFADTQHLVTYSDDYACSSASASPTTAHTPSCSDYSSMETINYVENPNYRKYSAGSGESFEMKPIGWNRVPRQHAEYVLVIGGLETHKSAVFSKRDLVVWRLRVDCFCSGGDYEVEESVGGGGGGNGDFIQGNIERGDKNFEVEF